MDYSPPGSSVHRIFPARILELVVILFSRGVFLNQGLKLGLLHCRQILYHLSHQENPIKNLAQYTSEAATWAADPSLVFLLLTSHKRESFLVEKIGVPYLSWLRQLSKHLPNRICLLIQKSKLCGP